MSETPEERARRISEEERKQREHEQDLVDMGSENLLNAILEERNRQAEQEARRQAERTERERKKTWREKRDERRDRRKGR